MKKRLAALVVGIGLMASSGCATVYTGFSIDGSHMTEGQKKVAGATILPFTMALDLALLPAELLVFLMIVA